MMIKGFMKCFRINISDIKIERRFNDSMSSLSSSKYMIELIVYSSSSSSTVEICKELKGPLKYSILIPLLIPYIFSHYYYYYIYNRFYHVL